MGFKTFRDRLTLIILAMILLVWLLPPFANVALAPEVTGATIVTFTLVTQFFFRKSGPEG